MQRMPGLGRVSGNTASRISDYGDIGIGLIEWNLSEEMIKGRMIYCEVTEDSLVSTCIGKLFVYWFEVA